ncbi:hypothetical protein KP509_13G061100 [Ceratopteris richardii]|uniref:Copper transport protein n=1 Tax=Ceratopteris richardii TaxID=49495 RepID=A0A8T2TFY7_CERRI|nr:hypothetical protein KP509_13G061100 [Ceratopteris richardii]
MDMSTNGTSAASTMKMKEYQMWFYWGDETLILAKGWTTTSGGPYFASLVALFAMAFVNQLLDRLVSRNSPLKQFFRRHKVGTSSCKWTIFPNKYLSFLARLFLGTVFLIRVSLAYLLMLAAMSFNGGVFIAIVLGFTAGYFVFRTDIHGGGQVL